MKLAIIFNGQGAHYENMGLDFAQQYEVANQVYEQCESVTNEPIRQWIEKEIERLSQTRYAQVAIVATSIAIYESIRSQLPEVSYMAGLSLGEYSAFIASGALSLKEGISLIQQRGELMSQWCEQLQEQSNYQMLAVMGQTLAGVQFVIQENGYQDVVHIANINSSQQIILAGEKDTLNAFASVAKANGIKKLLPLKVEGPFHSPLMAGACQPLREVLNRVTFEQGEVSVISNTTVTPHRVDMVRDTLVRHLVEPVQWQQTIDYFIEQGVTHIVQIGPGKTLAQLLKRESNAPRCLVIDKVEDVAQLHDFLQ